MVAAGRSQADIDNAAKQAVKWNRIIVRMAGETPEDWPNDVVDDSYAVFRDCLETFLAEHWPELLKTVHEEMAEAGTERAKPEEFYESAAEKAENHPDHMTGILRQVMGLARN